MDTTSKLNLSVEKTALFFGNEEMFDYKEAISGCAFLLHKIQEGKICEVYKLMKVMGWKRIRNMIRFMPFKILKKLGIMAYDAKPYLRKQVK